ncbi:MAG: DNA polymerase/3'-5' exonuclease PolX [Thermodesulfobacteriota bacterium]|jgi:DNA polymerase (family 10)|nr:MAG: DNA polymerase/3'-5' exonuclease PolX [Thermodesulfobacteriota bacterium]
MKNQEVANFFKRIADMLEIKGENPFRIRAYQKAAQNIENLAEDIVLIAERNELDTLPGIGKDLSQKITEIITTGTLQKYEELKKEIPEGLMEIITIPGLGPRTAKALFDELRVENIDQLEKLAQAHRLQGLPGIKAKTEENILKGIALYRQKLARMMLSTMLALSREITGELKKLKEVKKMCVAGSVRRYRETIKDIDILIISPQPEKVMDFFAHLPFVETVQAKGRTKSSIRARGGIQVDLRVVEPDCFGAALCYFTGSKAHNIRLRELAVTKGLKINEYGIFRGEKKIGGKDEQEIYASAGLPFIPPELREDRGEIEAALEGKLPHLVERRDIRGDFHVHSLYSDGAATLEEIARKAEAMGLEWVAICDHSQSLKIAGGLSIAKLEEKIAEIKKFNRKNKKVKLVCGTEVDISNDGGLDYPDELLGKLDVVIAAIHSGFKQDEKTLTSRIIKAMHNHRVHCIAHPTGRLIGERDAYAFNLDMVLDEAARTNTALEINAYPQRLDLNDIYSRAAKDKGVKLTIGTDAHSLDQMEYLELGLSVARRGWLGKTDILNCLSYNDLITVLKRKRNELTERM